MKILKKNIDNKRSGNVIVIPEEVEDLWHLYNMISIGDKVKCKTMRKIKIERGAGKMESTRTAVSLMIACEKTDFDPQGGFLRVSGKVCAENKVAALGQSHTTDVELNYPVTIYKNFWDSVHFQVLKDASDVKKKADVVALLIDQRQARIILITPFMSLEKMCVDVSTASKRYSDNPQKSLHKSFNNIIIGLSQYIDWEIVKCILIAGPGFVKTQFKEYLLQRAQTEDEIKPFWKNKERLLVVDASSAHFQVLGEILKDPSVKASLSDTKAYAEVQAFVQFLKVMRENEDLAIYGVSPVQKAAEFGAIDTLLITDELIRAANVTKRREFVSLVDSVKSKGGTVHVFSSLHSSGIQLKGMTGIAAILRYAVDLDSEDEEDEG